jgi:hypothetical protein
VGRTANAALLLFKFAIDMHARIRLFILFFAETPKIRHIYCKISNQAWYFLPVSYYLCTNKSVTMGRGKHENYMKTESKRCSVAVVAPIFSVNMIIFFVVLL